MSVKREIHPEELEAIFRVAVKYPDLRQVERDLDELAELRERVAKLSRLAVGGDPVQPRSVSDLLRLERAGLLTRPQVAERLGIPSNPVGTAPAQQGPPSPENAPERVRGKRYLPTMEEFRAEAIAQLKARGVL